MADKETPTPTATEQWQIDFSFQLAGLNKGHKLDVGIGAIALFHMYVAIRQLRAQTMGRVLMITQGLQEAAKAQGIPSPEIAPAQVWERFLQAFDDTYDPSVSFQDKPAKEEHVLGFTYALLRARLVNHKTAANLATALMHKQEPISDNAWRKRVDRWAKANGLTAVEQRKRGRKGE